MNKKEMYQKWENEILFPILQETVFIMQKEIQQNIEQIQKTICTQIEKLLQEIKREQHTSSFKEDEEFISYIKDGEYDINKNCGTEIDYNKDLKARSLLKNYVLYADYKRLAEFKQLYGAEYALLQAEYYKPSDL